MELPTGNKIFSKIAPLRGVSAEMYYNIIIFANGNGSLDWLNDYCSELEQTQTLPQKHQNMSGIMPKKLLFQHARRSKITCAEAVLRMRCRPLMNQSLSCYGACTQINCASLHQIFSHRVHTVSNGQTVNTHQKYPTECEDAITTHIEEATREAEKISPSDWFGRNELDSPRIWSVYDNESR